MNSPWLREMQMMSQNGNTFLDMNISYAKEQRKNLSTSRIVQINYFYTPVTSNEASGASKTFSSHKHATIVLKMLSQGISLVNFV